MTRRTGVLFVAAAFVVATAHVGSPDVVFDGAAGPYPVRVVVRPPNVVPGLAEVIVRTTGYDVDSLSMQPVFWRTGVAGSPSPDRIARVAGQTNVYSGQLWLMAYGSYSVYVHAFGKNGSGTAIVPVNSFATGRLPLSAGLGALLIVLGGFLLAGLVTIVRASAGESLVPPGEPFDAVKKRRANMVTAIAVPVLAIALFGGARWWNSVDARYRRTMFRPLSANPVIKQDPTHRTLTLVVRDTAPFQLVFLPVAPDHGKMMHLFLVDASNKNVFAHLHPVEQDSLVFVGEVPWLPQGKYRLFADIMLDNGLALTATNVVDLPDLPAKLAPSDSDDSWSNAPGVALTDSAASAPLGGGYSLALSTPGNSLAANTPLNLAFTVRDSAHRTVSLHPYLGMAAHAVVVRDDWSVFIHLHPMGTVSTTAQQVFRARDAGDTTARGRLAPSVLASTAMPDMSMSGDFTIPYEFPKPGKYRVWVQVKPARDVLTAAFDVTVR